MFFVRHPGDKDPAVYLSEELAIEAGAFWKLTRQTEFGLFFKEFLTYDDIWEHVDIEDIERETVKVEGPFFEARTPDDLREGVIEPPDMFDIFLEDE